MAVVDSLERRVEQLEATCRRQQELIDSLRGREAQGLDPRCIRLAKTIKVETGGYPTGGNQFGLQFIDREFVTDGTTNQPDTNYVDHPRSDSYQAIGATLNGHYIPEGSVVAVTPQPVAPGATSDGRWHILTTPLAVHWGITQEAINFLASGNVLRYEDSTLGKSTDYVDSVHNVIKNVLISKQVVYVQWGSSFLLIQAQGWF